MRRNSYDEQAQTITLSPLRARAVRAIQEHYLGLFGHDPAIDQLRENYAMPADTVLSPASRVDLTAFFFWASWASITERPGREYTYTSNWPPDELIGNRPTGQVILVSVSSFVLLLGGIGALVWFYAATREQWASAHASPAGDPLLGVTPTASMRATIKFFWLMGPCWYCKWGPAC